MPSDHHRILQQAVAAPSTTETPVDETITAGSKLHIEAPAGVPGHRRPSTASSAGEPRLAIKTMPLRWLRTSTVARSAADLSGRQCVAQARHVVELTATLSWGSPTPRRRDGARHARSKRRSPHLARTSTGLGVCRWAAVLSAERCPIQLGHRRLRRFQADRARRTSSYGREHAGSGGRATGAAPSGHGALRARSMEHQAELPAGVRGLL